MSEVVLPPDLARTIGALTARIADLERRASHLPTFTTATLPAASTVAAGAPVFVSDAAPGSKFQGSDGTNWTPLG